MRKLLLALSCVAFAACSSKFLKPKNPDDLKTNDEFEKAVTIVVPEEAADAASPTATDAPKAGTSPAKPEPPKKSGKKDKPVKGKKGQPEPSADKPLVHEPDTEDSAGFTGRRPNVDPFRVGESVVHDVHYFHFSAGTLTLKVDPMATVNGKPAYNFVTQIQTYPTFSNLVHAVDDKAVTLVDFEQFVPRVFTLHVKESNQLREARSFFDFDKLEARYWEKKITEANGVEEKRLQWEILPYSQNVFSAIFYMRVFKWETGKEYAFRVSDAEQNHVFTGKAIARETLDTELGPMKAIKIQADIKTKGIFKQAGDILIWLSDDDRKLVLRVECKIKIGTLVSEIIKLNRGRP